MKSIFATLALSAAALFTATNAAICQLGCQDIYKPVCGSDGVTYSNECEFEIAKCQLGDAGKDLYIKHPGKCEDPPVTTCNDACPKILFPVCGSDEITYVNPCEFERAKCHLGDAGKDLYIKHEGPCSRALSTVKCNGVCPYVYAPVCGSNGVTYSNTCFFEFAKCELGDAGKDLTIKHDGECGGPEKRALVAEGDCNFACTKEYVPVCGTNLVTYENKCLLEKAKCETNDPTLEVMYEGICRR